MYASMGAMIEEGQGVLDLKDLFGASVYLCANVYTEGGF